MTLAQDEQFEQIESESVSPLEHAEKTSDAQHLRRAIDQLPVDYRETLILREFEGLSYKEIAHIAGVPMGTVMSRLARAREKLVEVMAPDRAEQAGD
jgi:RNA polymerase sigma-70 factor (ECF subfamily)